MAVSDYTQLDWDKLVSSLSKKYGNIAEEAVQNAFVSAIPAEKNLRNNLTFHGWLRLVAERKCINIIRRAKAIDSSDVANLSDKAPSMLSNAILDEERVLVREAVKSLIEPFNAIIVDAYYNGLSLEELRQKYSIPLGTVKSRLWRGRELVRNYLVENGYEN